MRVTIDRDPPSPFQHLDADRSVWARGAWPASWISHPVAVEARPVVVAYRRQFRLEREATIRLHVSADERYQLYCDGTLLGRGPERGDPDHWFFETYDLTLPPGRHTLVARVWSIGVPGGDESGGKAGGRVTAPHAQMSVYHGLIVASDEAHLPLIATGVATWEAKVLPGYTFTPPGQAWGTGAKVEVDGATFAWNAHRGDGDGWGEVITRHAGVAPGRMEAGRAHVLRPATLPPMIERYVRAGRVRNCAEFSRNTPGQGAAPSRIPLPDLTTIPIDLAQHLEAEAAEFQTRLANRQPLHFPAHTARRLIIDLENYFCAYPVLVTTGGADAVVRLGWAESLFETPKFAERRKGNRNDIAGKYFSGVGDTFHIDGGAEREFETLWWQAGRYLELVVATADQPLEVNLILRETRYPLEMTATFDSSDPRLAKSIPILLRGLQMCAHETYVDCPYFEQLMYVGDTRLEALITYAISGDDRLPRKAIELFNASRLPGGLTQSRYPSRVRQVIPPFALWWIGMVHDFAMWRDDPAFVRAQLNGVRAVIDAFCAYRNDTGLVVGPADGWNYVDWVPGWRSGVPADADRGASGIVNWQFVYALRQAGELEEWFGDGELADRCRRMAGEITAVLDAHFWEPVRGCYADDLNKRYFSEHAQCLAILSGELDVDRVAQIGQALLNNTELARTTIYFTHYLFEAYNALGTPAATAALFRRLGLWFDLEKHGFVTPFEEPEPTRSDCHAWGSHPLFHFFTTIAGVRPTARGFAAVEVRPQFGPLTFVRTTIPHPAGAITVNLERDGDDIRGEVLLPANVKGTFASRRPPIRLGPNRNVIE